MTEPQSSNPVSQARASRRKRLAVLVLIALVGSAVWGAYDVLVASHQEDTDNAYVQGNIIQITPQVGGTVMAILADDNDFVRAGAPLVRLDPADTQVALKQAEAGLAQTVRQVRQLYANNATLTAQIKLRETDIAKARAAQAAAQSELQRAEQDVQRRLQLGARGAVSAEELKHAESAQTAARTQLAAARAGEEAARAGVTAAHEQLASNQALTQGVKIAEHPSVKAAAAQLRSAWLAAHRTELPAPVDGFIARRSVQLGQRVAAARRSWPWCRCMACGWTPTSRKRSSATCASASAPRSPPTCMAPACATAATSPGWAWARARRSRCCRRKTPPATGSRWCSASRCASRSTPSRWPSTRCAWARPCS